MGEPLSDEALAELRGIAETGTPLGPAQVLGLLDTIATDREAHEYEVFSLKAQVEKWHNALRVDTEKHRDVEAELRRDLDAERQRADQWKDSALAAERRGLCGAADVDAESPLRERLRDAIADTDLLDDYEAKQQVIDAVLPILSAEVTAKVSEAQTAVPEPLATGEVVKVEGPNSVPQTLVTIDVPMAFWDADTLRRLPGTKVGIWPASLAEQVADRELDNEGLGRDLDAMTAVAARLLEGWKRDPVADEWVYESPTWPEVGMSASKHMTDAERQALDVLDRLSETREGEANDG